MKITVIIPTTENSNYIKTCIKTLEGNSEYISDVILVNNMPGKIDFKSDILYIKNINYSSNRKSISKSWNIGISHRKSNVFLISNDDVAYPKNGFKYIVDEFLKNKMQVICPIEFFDLVRNYKFYPGYNPLSSFVNNFNFFTNHHLVTLSKDSPLNNLDFKKLKKNRKHTFEEILEEMYGGVDGIHDFWFENKKHLLKDIDYMEDGKAFGSSFFMTDEVLYSVGMFDENFEVGYCEDIDFKKRCEFDEVPVLINTDMYIHHFGCGTFRKMKESFVNIEYHNENKKYLDWKIQNKFNKNLYELVEEEKGLEEINFNLHECDDFVFKIRDINRPGNVICFCDIFGDPSAYFLIKDNDGFLLNFGFFSNGEWKNIDIQKVGKEVKIESKNRRLFIDDIDSGIIIPRILSVYISNGDARGKTRNSGASVELC